MSNILKAKVNNSFNFDVDLKAISDLDIATVSNSEIHILDKNESYHAKIVYSDFNSKCYKVAVNGTIYKVDIFNELDQLINKMGFSRGSKKAVKSIKAPMPGLILEINVAVGQEVKENDSLLILEAMKMENSFASPINGKIKSINVKKGDAVEKDQLLIEFE